MALLTPNQTYQMNGVTVNEKIIPDGTKWKDASKARAAGFSAGSLYKKQQKLSGGTGKAQSVTIHNTNDLDNVYDDGEQYTRATYNENMGSSRVHFYTDDTGAWQNLKAGTGLCKNDPVDSAEVSWHSGDGSISNGGNMTSVSIEIIMNETPEHDAKAYDNGARIAAWLLWKHGLPITKLVTHTYWVNKAAGKSFSDVDEQCCNPIYGQKWCPTYIFNSSYKSVALKNWKTFKAVVKKYLDALNNNHPDKPTPEQSDILYRVQTGAYSKKANADAQLAKVKAAGFDTYMVQAGGYYKIQVGAYSKKANADAMAAKLKAAGFDTYITTEQGKAVSSSGSAAASLAVGDKVKLASNSPVYGSSKKFSSWVYSSTLYVREISGNRVVISTQKTGAITGAVDKKYLTKI